MLDAGPPTQPDAPGNPAGGTGERKLVCFFLHGQEYGTDIAHVKETMAMRPITHVFLTPPWLAGIMSLRGEIVAVIDLALFLGLPAAVLTEESRILICRHQGKLCGVIVDALAELRTIGPAAIEPPPALSGDAALLFRGLVTLDRGVPLRLLNLGNLFLSERLRAFQRRES